MKKSKLLWGVSSLLILFNLVLYLSKIGSNEFVVVASNLLPVITALIAVALVFLAFDRFKSFDYAKISWLMILLGVIFYMLGELTYAILEIFYDIDMNEAFPSVADCFWCVGYLPFFFGLILMILSYWKGRFPMGNWVVYLFILISLIIVLSLSGYIVLFPILTDSETNHTAKFFYLFYPIADMVLLVPAVVLLYITSLFGRGTISKPWKYLVLGLIFFAIADLTYSYLNWRDLYGVWSIIDVLWNAGYLVIGLAAVYQYELIESINRRIE